MFNIHKNDYFNKIQLKGDFREALIIGKNGHGQMLSFIDDDDVGYTGSAGPSYMI